MNIKKKKALFVVDEFFPISSAPAVRVNSFIKYCSKNLTTEVLCGFEEETEIDKSLKNSRVKYHVIQRPPERKFFSFVCFLIKMSVSVIYLSVKRNPQIIVISIPKYELLISTIILKLLRKKFILDIRDSYSFINYDAYFRHFLNNNFSTFLGGAVKKGIGLLMNFSFRFCQNISVANDGIANEIKNYNYKVKVIPNGVDLNLFHKKKKRVTNNSLSLIYVGNFAEKDLFTPIIEAVDELRNEIINIKVILVGDGRNRYRLEKVLQEKRIAQHFELIGKVPHNRIPEYAGRADVGIILRQDDVVASIPVCIFEFMAAELPIIVNDVGKMSRFIRDTNSGFIVKDKIELKELIFKLYSEKHLIQDKASGLRESVMKFGSREKISEKFYNDVIRRSL